MIDQEKIEAIRSRLTLQYIAGFFDGEGSITVTKDLSLQAVIGQNEENILHAIAQYFECGTVSAPKIRRGHKQCYTLRWCGQKARKVLEALLPHLVLKRERAVLGIKLASMVGVMGTPVAESKWQEREQVAFEIKRINDSHWSRRSKSELVTESNQKVGVA